MRAIVVAVGVGALLGLMSYFGAPHDRAKASPPAAPSAIVTQAV